MSKKTKPVATQAAPNAEKGQQAAHLALRPSVNAAAVMASYQGNIAGKDIDMRALVDGLRDSFDTVKAGDLSTLEAMLIGQATALQSIFTSLARRAQVQEYQKNLQAFLTLALKAQAQSRATIQAVVELKYPRQVAFVQQANISHGPQQVNNGVLQNQHHDAPAHVEKNQTAQNKLLEDGTHGNTYLDTKAAKTASRSNPALETVEAVNRANKRRG